MRAASLLGVLVGAKALTLAGSNMPWSIWTPIAFLWQDLAFVLCFGTLDWLLVRPPGKGRAEAVDAMGVRRDGGGGASRRALRSGAMWALYALAVLYVAINIPIARAVSSPLTWPMLRAADGELADSVAHYATAQNLSMLACVLTLAAALPFVFRRVPRRVLITAAAMSLPLIALGPFAIQNLDTRGRHRNVLFTLAATAFPRVRAEWTRADWRASPLPPASASSSPSLGDYRGAAKGQNVVLVILESVGASYLAPYGAARDPMPNLSKLATRSVLFENAYVTYPESIKGLVSILSSVCPAIDTTAEHYGTVKGRSLGGELSAAGYRTGLFHSGRFMYLGMESVIRNRGYDDLRDAGDISGEHHSSFGVDEPSTVRHMFSWIDELPDDQAFFVTYMPVAGHHPYDTPEPGPYPEDNELDRYHNALRYADQAIGQLVAGLRKRQLDDNTLVVVVGDHGQAFGQHEDNYGHTFFVYEENVRVPLLIAAPSRATQVRVRRVVSVLDVAPTVLQLLGRSVPPEFQGASLLEAHPRMALFFTDYSLGLLGLRDGHWKFIHELESGRSKLFNLESDPHERTDLAASSKTRVAAYRDHLLRWSAAQRALILEQTD